MYTNSVYVCVCVGGMGGLGLVVVLNGLFRPQLTSSHKHNLLHENLALIFNTRQEIAIGISLMSSNTFDVNINNQKQEKFHAEPSNIYTYT